MSFQENALLATRDLLPDHKSLIGFVGAPWTVLSYGLGLNKGFQYENNYSNSFVFKVLSEKIIPLIKYNISLQLNAGAEVVMILIQMPKAYPIVRILINNPNIYTRKSLKSSQKKMDIIQNLPSIINFLLMSLIVMIVF